MSTFKKWRPMRWIDGFGRPVDCRHYQDREHARIAMLTTVVIAKMMEDRV